MNVRGEVHAYLPPEHYRRLKLEAAARQVSLSLCVARAWASISPCARKWRPPLRPKSPSSSKP
jgi:hypothetical protein